MKSTAIQVFGVKQNTVQSPPFFFRGLHRILHKNFVMRLCLMMILISGTFICNYNRALTGEINDNIIGYLGNLTKS